MVLLTRGRSQDQLAGSRQASQITAGCQVVVLNGRHFPSFSAGDEGVVLSVDQEAHNCFVRFQGNDTSVPVALRHLRATSQAAEAERQVEGHRLDAYLGSRDPGPDLRLDTDGEAAFGDAPAIDEVDSSMMRMDISTDSVMRGAEDASSSPFSLSVTHGGRSSSQANLQPVTRIPVSPARTRPQMVRHSNGDSSVFATAQMGSSAASVAPAVQNSGLLRNGGADGNAAVKTTAPAYIDRNANISSGIQVPPVHGMQRSGRPTFGSPSPQHSNSHHFEQQGRFLDTSSLSSHSEAPGSYGGGMSVLSAPPVANGQRWTGSMPTPCLVGGTQGDPNAAARGASEALEQRLVSIEAEHREKVTALRNALEECISAIMSCPQPPQRAEGMSSDPARDRDLLNAWQLASLALRSTAERGTQVLRVTANSSSSVGVRSASVVRSASCAGPRWNNSGATPVNVEVIGSSGQWDVSAPARESSGVRRNRSSSPAVGTGQRRYFAGSPNGKSGPQQVYRDMLNTSSGLPMSGTAGPLVGSPDQQHSGLLTPGSHARLSPGGASGILGMHQQPYLGWGIHMEGAPGFRGSPVGHGMQPPPSGHLNHSPGPMPGPGSFPGAPAAPPMGFGPGFHGWPPGAESHFPLLAPGAMPPLPGLGGGQTIGPPPGQHGSAGTRPETFQASGPVGGTFQASGQRPGSAIGPRPETFLDVSGSGDSSRPAGPVPDTFHAADPRLGQSMYVNEK